VRHGLRALPPPHLAAAQILEQGLAVHEPEGRVFQGGDLNLPHGTIRQLAHQIRMFAFPLRPDRGILQDAACHHLFVGIAARQRQLHAIGRLPHEPFVTDGVANHWVLPGTSDSVKFSAESKRCHLTTMSAWPRGLSHLGLRSSNMRRGNGALQRAQ
jgi:hypothetical protein